VVAVEVGVVDVVVVVVAVVGVLSGAMGHAAFYIVNGVFVNNFPNTFLKWILELLPLIVLRMAPPKISSMELAAFACSSNALVVSI